MNKTEIANAALRSLGVSWTISDFDNSNDNHAKVIRNTFQMSLDTVTEASEWSFLTKTRDLIYTGEGSFGWLYAYTLPADCLVLRKIGTEDCFIRENVAREFQMPWQFNNATDKILCNIESAWGEYTRRVLQNEDVPNYFGRAVAGRVAIDVAPALIGDKFAAIKAVLEKALKDDMDRAIAYDSGRQPNNKRQVSSYELLLE